MQLKNYSEVYRAQRIDLVFDTYNSVSLKAVTRRNHGKGVIRKDDSIASTD